MAFIIKQERFEGPLDLLLTLIEKRKFFVNDIALAKVTDDYIEYVKSLSDFPMADSANFILIASTLLLIKSKSLLPSLDMTEEEQEGIQDLERRLKIYKEIRAASVHVKELFGAEIIFAPSHSRPVEPVFSPDATMTLSNLAQTVMAVIRALPKKEFIPRAVVEKVVSLEDMIVRLTERVTRGLRMSFKEFSNMGNMGKEEKVNVIVSFLAMLELVKQGVIHVSQESMGSDIHMETKDVGVPTYT